MQLLLAQFTGSLRGVIRQILQLSGIRTSAATGCRGDPKGIRSNNVVKAERNSVLSDTLT